MLIRSLLIVWCGFLLSMSVVAAPFPSQSLPGVDIGDGLGAGYETSGIVWHSRLERFFTVDDDGQLSSMDENGSGITHYSGLSGDFEGVAIADPESDNVYIAREDGNVILEYDVDKSLGGRSFGLSTWMGSSGNSNMEALTFVSDESDPEGGLFYAGKQGDGVIYVFRLPIASSSTSTTVEFQFSFQAAAGRTDLSGLHYDATNDVLYAIWDSSNLLRAMKPDGTFLAEWTLPGTSQEGITFQGSNLLIAQDNGPDAIRYSSFPLLVTGDFDFDDDVDGEDFLVWQRGFGSTHHATELAGWEASFGTPLTAVAAEVNVVPEPSSCALLFVTVIAIFLCSSRSLGKSN